MNILLINHYAGSPEMGMEFRPYYFAREWYKMGHRVDIIAANYSHLRRVNPQVTVDFQEEVIDGIHYHWIKTGDYEGNGAKRAMTMAKFVGKLWFNAKKIVKNLDPDVVICSSTYPIDTYAGQRIRKKSRKKIKLIHEVHDMWPATLIELGGMSRRNPFVIVMQMGENSAYRDSDYVVSLLPNSEAYMKEHGLSEGKFRCIPNGVILEEWDNSMAIPDEHQKVFDRLRNEKKYTVGYFGGHALSNALDSLIDVAAQTDDQEIHFVLVGEGTEKKLLMEKAQRLNLDNITFLPSVNKRSIPMLCENFDCIIMCGINSPLYRFGLCLNKMFDTMASGKPGICALGVESYFTQYGCGYDVSPGDSEEILDAIYQLKTLGESKLQKMSGAGKNAVRDNFNYEKLAAHFEEIMF